MSAWPANRTSTLSRGTVQPAAAAGIPLFRIRAPARQTSRWRDRYRPPSGSLPSTYMLIHRCSQTHKTDWLSRLADERRSASRPGVMPRTRPQSAIQQLTVSLGNGCGAVDGLVAMLTDVNGHGHRKPLSLLDRTRPSSRQLKLRAAVGAAPPVPARAECRTWVERRSFMLSTSVLTDAQIWTILRPMATPCSQRPSQLVHPQKFRVPRSSAQRDPCVGRGRVKGIVR